MTFKIRGFSYFYWVHGTDGETFSTDSKRHNGRRARVTFNLGKHAEKPDVRDIVQTLVNNERDRFIDRHGIIVPGCHAVRLESPQFRSAGGALVWCQDGALEGPERETVRTGHGVLCRAAPCAKVGIEITSNEDTIFTIVKESFEGWF